MGTISFGIISLSLLLISQLMSGSFALVVNLEDLGTSSNNPDIKLKANGVEPGVAEKYTEWLNAQTKGWQMKSHSLAHHVTVPEQVFAASVPEIHRELLASRAKRVLLYIGMTADNERNVFAFFPEGTRHGSSNVAFVSTPRVWKSLDEEMQLHAFAHVNKENYDEFHHGLDYDFNTSPLDSMVRRIVPPTPQSMFDELFPRFVHPLYRG